LKCYNCKAHCEILIDCKEFSVCKRCFNLAFGNIIHCVVCGRKILNIKNKRKTCDGECRRKRMSVYNKNISGKPLNNNEKKLVKKYKIENENRKI